mmetsp:Transcript_60073/g.167611  ORF Transcript_60073/g.167611 Transcript_60073/m.167611 type:complete len:242 (+) Transcript_60073:302-1027(+)
MGQWLPARLEVVLARGDVPALHRIRDFPRDGNVATSGSAVITTKRVVHTGRDECRIVLEKSFLLTPRRRALARGGDPHAEVPQLGDRHHGHFLRDGPRGRPLAADSLALRSETLDHPLVPTRLHFDLGPLALVVHDHVVHRDDPLLNGFFHFHIRRRLQVLNLVDRLPNLILQVVGRLNGPPSLSCSWLRVPSALLEVVSGHLVILLFDVTPSAAIAFRHRGRDACVFNVIVASDVPAAAQ